MTKLELELMSSRFYKYLFVLFSVFTLFFLFPSYSSAQQYSQYYKTAYWPVGYDSLNTGGKYAFCSSSPCGIKVFDTACENFDATCAISPHAGCDSTGEFCKNLIMNNQNTQCLSTNHPYGDPTDYSAYCGPLEYSNCAVYGCYGFQFYIPGGPVSTPTPTPTPTPEPCITYGTTGNLSYPNTCAGTNGFYTDKCIGNQTITYSCNSSGACQSFTSPCNAGETCVVQTNGQPVCVTPSPTSTPTVT